MRDTSSVTFDTTTLVRFYCPSSKSVNLVFVFVIVLLIFHLLLIGVGVKQTEVHLFLIAQLLTFSCSRRKFGAPLLLSENSARFWIAARDLGASLGHLRSPA